MPVLFRCLLLLCLVRASSAQLDLPDRRPARPAPTPNSASANGEREAGTGVESPDEASAAAATVFAGLEASVKPSDVRVKRGVAALVALGDAGLEAARERLDAPHPAQLSAALHLLAVHGTPEDRAALSARLERPLPRGGMGAGLFLDLLRQSDPGAVSPAALVRLLVHPDAPMRTAARQRLEPLLDAGTVALLLAPLQSPRSSTRLTVLDLLAAIPGAEPIPALLTSLGDPSGQVSTRAAQLLAQRPAEEVVDLLRGEALGAQGFDRRGAFALLSLIEREDQLGQTCLGEADVATLTRGLADGRPLVSVLCAAGLAGIGYHSLSREELPWFNREVPHVLIREVGTEVFHRDRAALRRCVLTRLARITGENHGADGRAWHEWWGANAEGFRSLRSALPVATQDAPGLMLSLRGRTRPEPVVVLAPEARRPAAVGESTHRIVYLDRDQAVQLLQRLQAEELFEPTRVPGRLGDGPMERALIVSLPHGEKRFELGKSVSAPWFERVEQLVGELAIESGWQRWYDRERYSSVEAAWRAERAAWGPDLTPQERGRRLTRRVLGRVARDPGELEEGLLELERLLALPGVAASEHFEPLLEILATVAEGERTDSAQDRMQSLVPLLLEAGQAAAADPLAEDRAQPLLELLISGFGAGAREEIERVLSACDHPTLQRAAGDPRAVLRAAAAAPLASRAAQPSGDPGGAGTLPLLVELMRDVDASVAAAAIREAGVHGLQEARGALLLRVGAEQPAVRAASLAALARLGGADVLEVCHAAMGDTDSAVRVAAVEAVASLADPGSAAWLAAHLGRGSESPLFEPARRGLERLGPAAHAELTKLVSSPRRTARRAAALMLSRAGDARVLTDLLTLLTEDPSDQAVADELAVATCFDARAAIDPVGAWWTWWDRVPQDEPRAWLRLELERLGWPTPPLGTLEGDESREGASFLLDLCRVGEPHLRERARRELERRIGQEVSPAPDSEDPQSFWYEDLRAAIDERFPG